MARTNVPVGSIIRAGLLSAGGAVSEVTGDTVNDHVMVNTGVEFLQVRNSGGAEYDVTLITPGTVDGQAVADRVVAIPAGETHLIGPFPEAVYDQLSGVDKGNLAFTVENAALMLMAFKLS